MVVASFCEAAVPVRASTTASSGACSIFGFSDWAECQPCFCGEIPEAGNSNALGAVESKVASLTPKSSNFCLNCSGVYFLALCLGISEALACESAIDFANAPDAGNSNALGVVGSSVASLTPNSSNRFLISSGVYFLPLLPGNPAPEQPDWVVDCGKGQSGSAALVSAVDSWILGFISA